LMQAELKQTARKQTGVIRNAPFRPKLAFRGETGASE
jgi:hypothetical protein